MLIHELKVKAHKKRKRVGRGIGSGHGTYAGRGVKGQKARAGRRMRPGFEGGRTSLIAHMPKLRGFKSIHPKAKAISLTKLDKFFPQGGVVNLSTLKKAGLIKKEKRVKILDEGSTKKKFIIQVPISKKAKEKIQKAGGKAEAIK